MALRITTNVEAFNSYRHLNATQSTLSKSMEKLSSGYRINRGADDAAGLSISESMRSQIRGLAQAQKNIQDGVSMVQTAEGNLDQVHSMLQRARELAVKYNNETNSTEARTAIQSEVTELANEVDRVLGSAKFNKIDLLTGTAEGKTIQVGADETDVITVTLGNVANAASTNWSTMGAGALASIDTAINAVSAKRAEYGAVQNRLENTLAVQAAYQENLTAAESRIRDVDMAEEMVKFTKTQIIAQAGQAMLAQANQSPQQVLQLLRG